MGKEIIQFERFDHLLAIASEETGTELFINTNNVLVMRYSDYVKSQIHLNVVSDLFGRPMMLYKAALNFINGDITYEKEATEVLWYFYEDLINFLRRNSFNTRIEVVVDAVFPDIKCIHYSYQSVYDKLVKLANKRFDSFEESLNYVRNDNILDNVIFYFTNSEDLLARIDSFCAIGLLASFKANKIVKWEVMQRNG